MFLNNFFRKGSIKEEDTEYSKFLEARTTIIAFAPFNQNSGRLSEALITFVNAFFSMSDAWFKVESQPLLDLAEYLDEKQLRVIKGMIENKAKDPNNAKAHRADTIFLNKEEMNSHYRTKFASFLVEREKEIETNNQRSQVQFLLLEYDHLGIDKCLDMSKTEAFEIKLKRATQYLKDNHAIELQPLQFRNNLQSFGSNLINFYDLMNTARKSVADYYPESYMGDFDAFFKEHEQRFFPQPEMAKSIAAVKIVAAFQGNKIETSHLEYKTMCDEIELCLEAAPLERCLAYIKRKDEPADLYFKECLAEIYKIIEQYYKNTLPFAIKELDQKSLEDMVGKRSYSCPERPLFGNNNQVRVVKNPIYGNPVLMRFYEEQKKSKKMQPAASPEVKKPTRQTKAGGIQVTKIPSLPDIGEPKNPPPTLPKSYSAGDVHPVPTITPQSAIPPSPPAKLPASPFWTTIRPREMNLANQLAQEALAKKKPGSNIGAERPQRL